MPTRRMWSGSLCGLKIPEEQLTGIVQHRSVLLHNEQMLQTCQNLALVKQLHLFYSWGQVRLTAQIHFIYDHHHWGETPIHRLKSTSRPCTLPSRPRSCEPRSASAPVGLAITIALHGSVARTSHGLTHPTFDYSRVFLTISSPASTATPLSPAQARSTSPQYQCLSSTSSKSGDNAKPKTKPEPRPKPRPKPQPKFKNATTSPPPFPILTTAAKQVTSSLVTPIATGTPPQARKRQRRKWQQQQKQSLVLPLLLSQHAPLERMVGQRIVSLSEGDENGRERKQ
ncbi:uncharacterized protein L3040_005854 [Drepanopeziza brunnea f. sp. 'multigermtubi']|uniref:uncharacterized protein n=1 Tax=Drepanopeziza brunnea f. sp. 'multigermtubi' TaxID=698441 RepID=UPI0023A71DF4|nr:hypothetical protein L3040_005854 [Drepanopeziza brunnea f. sp. 'multigermtubi']